MPDQLTREQIEQMHAELVRPDSDKRMSDEWIVAANEWRDLALRALAPGMVSTGPLMLDNGGQVFFYEQDHYYLSNFSAFKVRFQGVLYDTSEHAYQAQKFYGDESVDYRGEMRLRWEISSAPSAHDAFKMAEQNAARRNPNWDAVKVGIMRDILRTKAKQHEYVHRKLLQTGNRTLIENSWRDDFWGWGHDRNGQNMLGKLWMEIRAELLAARPQSQEE